MWLSLYTQKAVSSDLSVADDSRYGGNARETCNWSPPGLIPSTHNRVDELNVVWWSQVSVFPTTTSTTLH